MKMEPRGPLLKGISHLTFLCKDLDKSLKLFEELFLAEEVYTSEKRNFSYTKEKFLKAGDLWIALMEKGISQELPKTYNHIAFLVDIEDLPWYEKKVLQLNLEVLPGRARAEEEGKSLYFFDYDNHLFELHTGTLETRLKYYAKASVD